MRTLKIWNIGPLTFVDMKVNRVNMIIGPQSSGKSTIAKILSFCLWLEKDVIAHQEKDYLTKDIIREELLDYHKINNYLNTDSKIEYKGEYINFYFTNVDDFSVELTSVFSKSEIGKVAYIPSERNLVALGNLSGLKLPDYYVRDYLFDWLNLHTKFEKKNKVSILDLGVSYYFDEEGKGETVQLDNGKELEMNEVSSGLQSLIPLMVSLEYVTKWIFQHKEDMSFDKNSVLSKALIRAISPNIDNEHIEEALTLPKMVNQLQETLKAIINHEISVDLMPKFQNISKLNERIQVPHYVNLIVEEPEQNLFPKTQVTLIYEMLRMLDREDDILLITTHSPYTLYALNNCMLGNKVKDVIDEDEIKGLASKGSWIDGDRVSIWQVTDQGSLKSLKESPAGLIGKHYFNDVMNETLNEYHTMIDYLEL